MSPCENDTPINWKRNLIVAWLGCFLTGAAFSLVMPFLPLYVEQLGVTEYSALNMWSGIVFSITFLFLPSPHRFGVDSPTVKAENSCYYALLSAWAS